MPELPEVETIKQQLKKAIIGKKIAQVKIKLVKMINLPLRQFTKIAVGAKIKDVKRRAKILILELDNGWSILIHLKLTGQLIFCGRSRSRSAPAVSKHTHIIYQFTDGTKLYHNDLRQFGWERLIKTKDLPQYWQKEKLGLEPLALNFTIKDFQTILQTRPKSLIKPLLMDQKFIAGIGNIYSDEVLFDAGVQPARKAGSLTDKEISKLFKAIKQTLKKAIDKCGSSVQHYLDVFGQQGEFVPYLNVYGREDQPCKKCGAKIKRLKLKGRSAHYCSKCQK